MSIQTTMTKITALKAAAISAMVLSAALLMFGITAPQAHAEAADISTAKVTIENQTFTGTNVTPRPTVTLDGKALKSSDYAISYDDSTNVKPGLAKLKIIGVGPNYTGEKECTYKIIADMTQAKITVPVQEHTGKALTPKPVVTIHGMKLVYNTNFTVNYYNNKNVGKAQGYVVSKGTYFKNQKAFSFSICTNFGKVNGSVAKAKIANKIADIKYNGYAKKPSVTVQYNKKTLKRNTDYTVTYTNNIKMGTAKVTVKGTGKYMGSVSKSFKIVANMVTVSSEGLVYKITGTDTAQLYRCIAKRTNIVNVAKNLKASGRTYHVTDIRDGAFANSKTVKTVVINSTYITTKAGLTNAFKSSKVTKVKVPASKLTTYKSFLKMSNCGKVVSVYK